MTIDRVHAALATVALDAPANDGSSMTSSDIIMVLAVLVGPILAVQAQKLIESLREKKHARRWVFQALMATRAARVSPRHVEALNMIDLHFQGEVAVLASWKVYLDHLNAGPGVEQPTPAYQAQLTTWLQKGEDFLNDLLYSMSKAVGFKFDRVQLKRGVYAPIAQVHADADLEQIRRSLAQIMSGKEAIPIRVVGESGANAPPQQGGKTPGKK